jgi:hypothetical protein
MLRYAAIIDWATWEWGMGMRTEHGSANLGMGIRDWEYGDLFADLNMTNTCR